MSKKVNLELVGLDGNAFALIGAFQKQARKEGWTPEEIKAVRDEAMNGDYDHLLATLAEHCCGDYDDVDEDDEDDYDNDDEYDDDDDDDDDYDDDNQ